MAARKKKGGATPVSPPSARSYTHSTSDVASRPDIGTQSQFRKKKPAKTYKYDSSLSPSLDWDGQNAAREHGEALIQRILSATSLDEARSAAAPEREREIREVQLQQVERIARLIQL